MSDLRGQLGALLLRAVLIAVPPASLRTRLAALGPAALAVATAVVLARPVTHPARSRQRTRPSRRETQACDSRTLRQGPHARLLVGEVFLLRTDDGPRPHDAEPGDGLVRGEALMLHEVEADERACRSMQVCE